MTRWRVSTIIFLATSIFFAGAFLLSYQQQVQPSDLKELQHRINVLEEKNAFLTQNLYQANLTLEYYKKQAELYREKVAELEARGNKTLLYGLGGFSTLDAPAVRQRIEYIGEYPFTEKRIVYEGTMMEISVEIKPGEGRVLVVTKPLMGVVFQDAANTAVYVAQKYTGKDLSGNDIIFSVVAEEEIPAVDGPSAGALMALLTISAIEEKPLAKDLTLTGTIDSEGRVGGVGGIIEKATAAKKGGKSLILIPRENSQLIQYIEVKREIFSGFYIIERKPRVIDAREYIEENIGIEVEYIEDIKQVLTYFK